jgi:hypothetical protein
MFSSARALLVALMLSKTVKIALVRIVIGRFMVAAFEVSCHRCALGCTVGAELKLNCAALLVSGSLPDDGPANASIGHAKWLLISKTWDAVFNPC